jgi:hypothetical protein
LVGTVCRWSADGVLYWLELVVGDVWNVWYTVWNWLQVMCGRCGLLVATGCRWCVEGVVYWLELVAGDVWTVCTPVWTEFIRLRTDDFSSPFAASQYCLHLLHAVHRTSRRKSARLLPVWVHNLRPHAKQIYTLKLRKKKKIRTVLCAAAGKPSNLHSLEPAYCVRQVV